MSCCLAESCNIAFIVDERCYHVQCVSDELCLPLPRPNSRKWGARVSMILVKPVLSNGILFFTSICSYIMGPLLVKASRSGQCSFKNMRDVMCVCATDGLSDVPTNLSLWHFVYGKNIVLATLE